MIDAGAPLSSWYLTLGDLLVRVTGVTTVSLVLLGLSGIILTWMLFRHKMVPRVISVVGLVGYTLTLFGGLATWFGLIDPASAGATIINVPVAVFEIILLPFWLFLRGFKMPEATETEVSE